MQASWACATLPAPVANASTMVTAGSCVVPLNHSADCSLGCQPGYRVPEGAHEKVQCVAGVLIADPVFTECDRITCPAIGLGNALTVDSTSTAFDTTVTFNCPARAFILEGSPTATCTAAGTWSAATPTCVPQQCTQNIAAPTNGAVNVTTRVIGDVAGFTCAANHRLNGSATSTCGRDLTWSHPTPSCVRAYAGCNEMYEAGDRASGVKVLITGERVTCQMTVNKGGCESLKTPATGLLSLLLRSSYLAPTL